MDPSTMTAAELIETLELERHPEGGWYRQTFADVAGDGERPASTAIYYLLEGHDKSAWHRVDAIEIWHFYAGAPLLLTISHDGAVSEVFVLGADVRAGEMPQVVVPKGSWQTARSLGDWTLAGCTVAPGFQFTGFELAPAGWQPEGER